MEQVVGAVRASGELRPFVPELKAINCHQALLLPVCTPSHPHSRFTVGIWMFERIPGKVRLCLARYQARP
jgi:hypothetical protein